MVSISWRGSHLGELPISYRSYSCGAFSFGLGAYTGGSPHSMSTAVFDNWFPEI